MTKYRWRDKLNFYGYRPRLTFQNPVESLKMIHVILGFTSMLISARKEEDTLEFHD